MTRLTKENWLDHGFAVLKLRGHEGLKADAMVRDLGITRGSFYGYFASIGAFHEAVLKAWSERITQTQIAELKAFQQGPGQLRELIRRILVNDQSLEAAVRRWAGVAPFVAHAVQAVDQIRRAYIAQVLEAYGFDRPTAEARALFFTWAYVGHAADRALGAGSDPNLADPLYGMLIGPPPNSEAF